FGDEAERPPWAELHRSGVAIFDLDYDAILAAMYALSVSPEGDCYLCVPPDPGIEAAALVASESTLPAKAFHTFTLDSGDSCCFFRDSTTLTPLSAPVPVRLADPSGAQSLPVPPLFSHDAMVTTTTPWGQRVLICMCTRTGRHLATFTRRPGSSLYTLAIEPPQVVASAQVSSSDQVAPPCSCRLLSHQTLLWHHRLGHPSLPRLRGMHSRLLVSVRLQLRDRFHEDLLVLRLHSDRGAPLPPLPLFLTPGPPPPSCVSQVDPFLGPVPVEVAVDSGAARGVASRGAASGGAEPRGAEFGGAGSQGAGFGGAEPACAEPAGVEPAGEEPGGAEPRGTASSGDSVGASPRLSPQPEPPSPQQLREWFAQCTRLRSGATGAGDTGAGGVGATSLGGAGVTAGAGGTGGAATAGPGGARARGTGADEAGTVGGAGSGGARVKDPAEPGGAGTGGPGAGGAGPGGAGAGDTRAVDPGAGGAGSGGAVSDGTGAGGTVRPRPQPPNCLLLLLTLNRSKVLQSVVSLRLVLPCLFAQFVLVVVFLVRVLLLSPARALWHFVLCSTACSSATSSCVLSSFRPDPESDLARAASPTVSRLLATVVTDPSFDSTAASALVAELVDFAAACRLDYATALVAESESASPPSVGGECALGTDVLEDSQEDFECLAAAIPRFASMLLAPEGDLDALDIPTPRSYV
ncbi:unnamed protein product, partial [Closterium sp. NIES-54]